MTTGVEVAGTDRCQEIFAWYEAKPSVARAAGAVRQLERLHADLPGLFGERSALVLRSFTVEPVEPFLKLAAFREGMRLSVAYSGYDPLAEEDCVEAAPAGGPDVVLLVVRVEDVAPRLAGEPPGLSPAESRDLADSVVQRVAELARSARVTCGAPVLVHNFVAPAWPAGGLADTQQATGQVNTVRRMNLRLAEVVGGIEGCHLLDLDLVMAGAGTHASLDWRGARQGSTPLTPGGLDALAQAQVRHIRALGGPLVKCVVVDCDNTLWGGVVGEEGVGGIQLGEMGPGRKFWDLQRQLLQLRRRGVLLAVCSKNDERDVVEVLARHPECVLGEEDFAAMRVNWRDKVDNLVSLSEELGFDLAHMLFVDDDELECEAVRARVPRLRTLRWPADLPGDGRLDSLALFDSLSRTDEDGSRTEMYRAEAARRSSLASAGSREEHLGSLQLVATVGLAGPGHLSRLAQLCQKTNQFNLTLRRHHEGVLAAMASSATDRVAWLALRDRFGEYGIVGCGVLDVEADTAMIDTLLLSCRVLGRRAETALVGFLGRQARLMGATRLVGRYVAGERNSQVADLYPRLGFQPAESPGRWWWDLAAGDPPVAPWLQVLDAGER